MTTPAAVTGIILAAGEGERMGGPKALLAVRWGEGPGELPLAIAHARSMLDGGVKRVVVVTRGPSARALSRFRENGLEIIVSEAEGSLGPAGSLGVALRFVEGPEAPPPVPRGAVGPLYLVTPVDTPPPTSAVRSALRDALTAHPSAAAARPVFEGRRGHPVLISGEALQPMKSEAPPTLRDLLRDLGDACIDVTVTDPRATLDLDRPEDVEGWYKAPPRFFSAEEA